MVTAEYLPHVLMFYSPEKAISVKNPVLPTEKSLFLVLHGNVIMFATPYMYYPISALLPVKWSLWELRIKRKF